MRLRRRMSSQADSDAEGPRRPILIGSQRDPAAYRARQRRDWTPIDDEQTEKPDKPKAEAERQGLGTSVPSEVGSAAVGSRQ